MIERIHKGERWVLKESRLNERPQVIGRWPTTEEPIIRLQPCLVVTWVCHDGIWDECLDVEFVALEHGKHAIKLSNKDQINTLGKECFGFEPAIAMK